MLAGLGRFLHVSRDLRVPASVDAAKSRDAVPTRHAMEGVRNRQFAESEFFQFCDARQ